MRSPPDLKVECNDRLSSRNPAARNSATSLPEMPNAHEAYAYLIGAYRIWTSHVRLLQMRSRRTNRYSVRSNEVGRCWLARWRTTAANIDHAFARHCRKAQIENTRSRSFAGRGIHCRRDHNRGPILISLFSEPRDLLRRIVAYLQSRKHFGLRDNHRGRAPRNTDPAGSFAGRRGNGTQETEKPC